MNTEREQILGLLTSIGNSPILKTNDYDIAKNLFPILYNKIREKELMHSEAIALILEKSIRNRTCNFLFTSLFEIMKINNYKCDYDNIIIETERRITKDRRIDILLTWEENNNKKYAIIIENKLNNAPDQINQLSDYYRDIKNEGYEVLKIVYLPASVTKRAKEIGDIEADNLLINLYPVNLIEWLTNFVQNGINIEDEYRSIIQGYITILKLTDMENKRIEENFELARIIGENETNILSAYKIQDRWNDIKWHTEWDFWNDFKEIIKEPYKKQILNEQKFSQEYISSATHRKQNRDVFYGITFKIAEKNDYLVCLSIERGYSNMYYGIIVKDGNEEWQRHSNNEVFKILKEIANQKGYSTLQITDEDLWVLSKHFKHEINFDAFSSNETLKLINKGYRTKILNECWKEIEHLISDFKEIVDSAKG